MTKDDFVIVCGDFGYWHDTPGQRYWHDWLDKKPFTTLFVDGNHENFDRLREIPVRKWNGGNARFINDSIIHLERGQVFEIDGCKIFTFGGAKSHDVQGGILNRSDPDFKQKKRKLERSFTPYRINHETWWKEETPSDTEMNEGIKNLQSHNNLVDYIISHDCPTSTQAILSNGFYKPDFLTDYLQKIKETTQFSSWYFGHYHKDRAITNNEILTYENINQIW